MERRWYYRVSGRECGPVPFERVAELVRHRRLLPADEILQGSEGAWRRICDVEELRTLAGPGAADTFDEPGIPAKHLAPGGITDLEQATSPSLDWYCMIREEILGPYRAVELQGLLAERQLNPLDLVRRGPTGNWKEYFQWERHISADANVEIAKLRANGLVPKNDMTSADQSASTIVADQTSSAQAKTRSSTPQHTQDSRQPRIRAQVHRSRRDRMRKMVREHWPLAAALGLILTVNLFALYESVDPNRERYQAFNAMWNRMQLLRDRQAPPAAWEELAGEVPKTIQPMINSLNHVSDIHHPIEQHLLWASRDYLLPILKEYQEESRNPQRGPRRNSSESAAKERRFQLHMDEAARLFDHER